MNPVAFSIFGLSVYWYGICYSVSILIIRHYFYKFCYFFSFPMSLIDKGLLYAVCFGVVFARIFDVLVYDYHNFTLNPLLIFSIRDGGLSFHGAVIGLILCVFVFVHFHKNFYQKFEDSCSMALMQSCDRSDCSRGLCHGSNYYVSSCFDGCSGDGYVYYDRSNSDSCTGDHNRCISGFPRGHNLGLTERFLNKFLSKILSLSRYGTEFWNRKCRKLNGDSRKHHDLNNQNKNNSINENADLNINSDLRKQFYFDKQNNYEDNFVKRYDMNKRCDLDMSINSKKRGRFYISVLKIFDFIAIFSPICIFLVRIGNFINQELIGRPCSNAWYAINVGKLRNLHDLYELSDLNDLGDLGSLSDYYVYPSQLIESFFEGFVLFFIMFTLMSRVLLKNILSKAILLDSMSNLNSSKMSSKIVEQSDEELNINVGNVFNKPKIGMFWMVTHMLFDVNIFQKIALRLNWKLDERLDEKLCAKLYWKLDDNLCWRCRVHRFHLMIYNYNSRGIGSSRVKIGSGVSTGVADGVFPGFYLCVFLFLYGIFRFFCEFFRMPEIFLTCGGISESFLGDFCRNFFTDFYGDFLITIGQIFSLGMILMSILLWFACKKIKM